MFRKIKICTLFLFIFPVVVYSQEQECFFSLSGNVHSFGDSRSQRVSSDEINNAKAGTLTILKNNPVNVAIRGKGGSSTEYWVKKLYQCRNNFYGFFLLDKVFMSLGGIDLIDLIKATFSLRESYSVLTHTDPAFAYMKRAMSDEEITRKNEGLQNPSRSFSEMQSNIAREEVTGVMNNYQLSGGLYNEFWETTSRISEDQIAKNVEYIVDKLLQYDSNRKIILTTVNPLCAKPGWAFSNDYKEAREHKDNLILLFDNLRSKFRKRVFPNLFRHYGLRIVLLDQYNSFKNNCTFKNGDYYLEEDGIHFTDAGDREFSKGLAYFMGMLQWFSINDEYFSGFFYSDPAAFLASMAIDMKAVGSYQDDPDFSFDHIIYTKLIATKRGFYKDFFPGNLDRRRYIAVRDSEDEAFYVKGLISDFYGKNEAGPDGRFGFPLRDEWEDNFGTIRNSDFECGRIYFNYIGHSTNTSYQPSLTSCQRKLQEESNWQ